MSSNKQRKARQRAEREQWEREQQRLAAARRRRTALLGALAAAAVALVIGGVVVLVGRDDPDPNAGAPAGDDTELIDAEASGEAQASAANAARAAGDVVAEDYTVEPGTPVPGREKPARDDRPVACGAEAPADARAVRPRFPGGPAEVLEQGVDYVARIRTSCGPIVIDLLEQDAPVAVNSFVFLAQQGFYDGLEVYRDYGAIAAVQAGSGTDKVGWDVGYTLPDELGVAEREGYPVGSVVSAGLGRPWTAGSEFWIAYGPEFDAGFETDRVHTTFGRVLSGMDVVERLTALERLGMGGESFAERLFMEKVTVEER